VVSPKDGTVLAMVEGDPDGPGPQNDGDYSLLVLWRGLRYNVLSFGLTTSELSGCSNCLGWDLFNQALNWTSGQENMGFDFEINKDEYFIGDRINIDVSSHVDMEDVSGKIIYPDDKSYDLAFTGSGKNRESIYLLQDEDPTGEYIISVTADTLEIIKEIRVNVMTIDVYIDNITEDVWVDVELKDKYGRELDNCRIDISVQKKSGLRDQYSFMNVSSAHLTYNVSESGSHTIYVIARDVLGRTQSTQDIFYFSLKPNITFSPENITETVHDAVNLTRIVYLTNQGNETLTNIVAEKVGDISDWIDFNDTPFDLSSGAANTIVLNITVSKIAEGKYTGHLNFTSDQGFSMFSITINLDYLGKLNVYPSSQTEVLTLNQRKEVEFWLNNSGEGSLEIKSVIPSMEISDWVYITNKPRIITARGKSPLQILVSTESVGIDEIFKTITGSIDITTDLGSHYPSPSLTLKVFSDISREVESFYPDLIELEKKLVELKEETDVSGFREQIDTIRVRIANTQELYSNDQLESAYQMYNEIKDEVDKLKTLVQQKENELIESKRKVIRTLVTLVAVVVVAVVGYKVYKEVKKHGEWSWLYKKWKKR